MRVIISTAGIAIFLLILGIGISIADIEADAGVEDVSLWGLPKAAKARLGKGGINALTFSPDGTQFAVGSNIGIWLYDVAAGKEIAMFPGMCQSVAFSQDGRYLASGGGSFREHALKVWETATRREITRMDGLYAARDLRFSSDGKTLIGLNKRGNAINTIDVETGKRGVTAIEDRSLEQIRSRRGPESYALTHDKIAVGGENGTIALWDTTTGKKRLTLTDRTLPSPLGENKKIRLRDRHIPFRGDRSNHVLALAFSPDGTRLASGSKDAAVRLQDTAGTETPIVLQGHEGWINALAFSADGSMLASGSTDRTVQLWDTTTGEMLATFSGHLSVITALVFSPDSRTLASGSADGTVRFWSTETAEALSLRITGHTEWVKAVAFLDDGSTLASVAFNGVITLWDLKTLERTDIEIPGRKDMLSGAAFSPDGTRLASVATTGEIYFDPGIGIRHATRLSGDRQMGLTDVRTGRTLATFTASRDGSPIDEKLAFSPDGETVALGGAGSIRVWNTSITDKDIFLDIPLTESAVINENGNEGVPPGLPHGVVPRLPDQVNALVFTPDGKKLVGGTLEGLVQMWDAETGIALAPFLKRKDPVREEGKNLRISYQEGISALAYSGDSALLAVGSSRRTRLMGRHKQIRLKEIPHGTRTLVFSPDRMVLVTAFGVGKIELWSLITGAQLTTLEGHTTNVGTLLFSPDGKTLVSAGRDGTILLWDWDAACEVPEIMDN